MKFAETTIDIKADNRASTVKIVIFAPVENDAEWSCVYEISWPEGIKSREVYGRDSAQCLVLACFMVGADLYSSAYHQNGQLERDGVKGDFGFPVSQSIRGEVEGYVDF